jgi:predicted outer membrane repeat protein
MEETTMKRAAVLALLFGASLTLPTIASGKTIDVPGEFPTIQGAVNVAASGDVIAINPGTYTENITLKNGVSLQGAGMGVTVIDGGARASCIYVGGAAIATTRIQDLTVTNGRASNGGGIKLGSENSCEIRRVEVRGNTAKARGGGIYADVESRTLIEECRITGNTAQLGGGIYCQTSFCTLRFNVIELNNGTQNGGGLYCAFDCSEIANNTIDANTSVGAGSGVAFSSPVSARFVRNIVSNNGGGYGVWSSGGKLGTGCNVYWSNNLGDRSGGALVADESITDPMYCNYPQRDLELNFASNAADAACSDVPYIGALPPACGATVSVAACCFPDGECAELTADDCVARGGALSGPADCASAACAPLARLGACCLQSYCATDTPESECIASGGRWLGAESTCEASPCVNATQAKSWGEVKALFR